MPMIVDSRIPSHDVQRESRRSPATGRQQSQPRYGEWVGPHRGLRAGHVSIGVTRELRRANASPCVTSGVGVPSVGVKTPGAERQLAPLKRTICESKGTQSQTSDARYRGRRGKTERPRDGPLAVLASHSTEGREPCVPDREGGEPTSQGPTGGKETPGITCVWRDLWEILRDHQPYP